MIEMQTPVLLHQQRLHLYRAAVGDEYEESPVCRHDGQVNRRRPSDEGENTECLEIVSSEM